MNSVLLLGRHLIQITAESRPIPSEIAFGKKSVFARVWNGSDSSDAIFLYRRGANHAGLVAPKPCPSGGFINSQALEAEIDRLARADGWQSHDAYDRARTLSREAEAQV
jgi:hypothetical protein